MENRTKSGKMATDADERFARIETHLAKLEQKIDDRQSRMEKSMEEMLSMFTDFMSTTRRSQATEASSNSPTRVIAGPEGLPVFDGVDPIGWIIRVNHWFEVLLTPEKDKAERGLVSIESLAPRWANWVRQNQPDLTWAQLCGILVERYDGRFKRDVIEQICKLKHTGDIEEYIGDFVRAIVQLRGIPDKHCVGLFLQGLRPEDRTKLRILGPKKLQEAIALARDTEDDWIKSNPAETYRGSTSSQEKPKQNQPKEAPPIEEDDDDDSSDYEAFKLRGRIKNEEVIVLVSTGSNYSCVSSSAANRLNLKRSDASRYRGMDVLGQIFAAKGLCRDVRLSLGSCSFVVDLFVFDLGLCDVIMGRDWMKQIGNVMIGYGYGGPGLAMSFDWEGSHHRLRSEKGLTKGAECGSLTLLLCELCFSVNDILFQLKFLIYSNQRLLEENGWSRVNQS